MREAPVGVYEQPYVNDPAVRAEGYDTGAAVYGCDRRTGGAGSWPADDTSDVLVSYYGAAENFEGAAMAGDVVGLLLV